MNGSKNVLGGALLACSYSPLTGFYRSGCCETGPDDLGRHIICVRVTESFLEFSRTVGDRRLHGSHGAHHRKIPVRPFPTGRPCERIAGVGLQ